MIGRVSRRQCACPRASGGAVGAADVNVGMSTVSLSVQRRAQGSDAYVSIPNGEAILPGETVRYYATGVAFLGFVQNQIGFEVFDADGDRVDAVTVGTNLEGQARYDTQAPLVPGVYTVRANYQTLIGRSTISTPFRVAADAPRPPQAPPQGGVGGVVGGITGDLKGLGLIALGIVALMAVSSIARR